MQLALDIFALPHNYFLCFGIYVYYTLAKTYTLGDFYGCILGCIYGTCLSCSVILLSSFARMNKYLSLPFIPHGVLGIIQIDLTKNVNR